MNYIDPKQGGSEYVGHRPWKLLFEELVHEQLCTSGLSATLVSLGRLERSNPRFWSREDSETIIRNIKQKAGL